MVDSSLAIAARPSNFFAVVTAYRRPRAAVQLAARVSGCACGTPLVYGRRAPASRESTA